MKVKRAAGIPQSLRHRPRQWIEISYSSTLLLLWSLLLAVMSWKGGFRMQAATVLTLCSVALTSEHGESRLIVPLLFLAERCFDDAIGLSHSPLEFYASTLLSYLTLVACKAERKGRPAGDRKVMFEAVFYGAVGLSVLYFIVQDRVISLGAVGFVVSGYIFFLRLLRSLGENEAVLVASLVGFIVCDVCMNNNLSRFGGRDSIFHLRAAGYSTTYAHIAGRGVLICAIVVASMLFISSPLCLVPVNLNSKSSERRVCQFRITTVFWVALISTVVLLHVTISYQFHGDALAWVAAYLTASSFRLSCVWVWGLGIPLAVLCVECGTNGLRRTARRKLFHLLGVIAFTPAAMIDPPFLAFALSVATGLTMVVEVARFYGVYGTECISRYFSHHIDERDSLLGIVRTHLYLLFGLGAPLIIRYRRQLTLARPIPAIVELSTNFIPGIITLGIVDASAAIIGSSFLLGSRRVLGRYLKNSLFTERANSSIAHKTTTGTLGGLVCGVLFWCLILAIADVPLVGPVWYTFLMIVICSITECFMDGIDNLQMPLIVLGSVYTLFALLIPIPSLWEGC